MINKEINMTTTSDISVIIKFKDMVNQSNIDFIKSQDANIRHIYGTINAIAVTIPKNKIGKIMANPNVEYVEIDQDVQILGFPNALRSAEQRNITATSQSIPWGITKIRAPEVHQTGNKGTGIKVCVIDTGIDYNHEDLSQNYKGGYNFVNNTSNPMDDHGHGTHVSGTIAALDNNIGVIGVAPEAYIYATKVLDKNGSGSYSNVIAGIQWAIDNKMQVISMSLGGSGFSQTMKDACDKAYNSGIVIVAAAGNSGSNSDTIGYPAKFDSVIAIGATDSSDNRASFSSVGPSLELSAPGVSTLSTVPKGTCSMCDPSGYRSANGTSMATPHVSGTVALILKAHPNKTNAEIRKMLQETVVDLGKQGRDIYFGYGRIDAKAAVDQTPPTPGKRYRCTGEPNYQCIEDPNGPYDSLEKCQSACSPTPPPEKRYRCTGEPNYQCIEDPNGPYKSIEECRTACKTPPPPSPDKKYLCMPVVIWRCVEHKLGRYTLDECKIICEGKNQEYQQF
jgi:subtilisin